MKKFTMFELEDLRANLAGEKKYEEFKKTYLINGTVNKNTGSFWNNKFSSPEKYEQQDKMTRDKIDYIISLLPKRKSKILDLGIGQGYLEQRLEQLGMPHEIYGIDISKTSINRSIANFRGKFIVGDILNIDKLYRKNFFDCVVAIEVIEHISPTNTLSFYKKVRAILKRRGKFIISTPLNEGLRNKKTNPSAHVRDYTIPTLTTEFQLCGFKLKNSRTFFAFKKNYFLKLILSKLLISRWKPNNIVVCFVGAKSSLS